MAIVADIKDLAAAEFLLMLSQNQKSGKLTGTSGEHKVQVVLRGGSIVYAASTAARQRVGSALVSRGLITERQLGDAIKLQQKEAGVKHLGNILVETGAIDQAALEDVVRGQFQKVIIELLSWTEGVLVFSTMAIPDLGAVHVDPRDILVDMGFETELMVMRSIPSVGQDKLGAAAVAAAATTIAGQPPRQPAQTTPEPAIAEPVGTASEPHQFLRSMMDEMKCMSASIDAEDSLEILTTALPLVERAMLLTVHPTFMGGIGGFGFQLPDRTSEEFVRGFFVLRKHQSVFSRVVEAGASHHGPPGDSDYDRHLLDLMGGERPTQVMVVPLKVRDEVVGLFYADNAINQRAIENPLNLETVVLAVGDRIAERTAGGSPSTS